MPPGPSIESMVAKMTMSSTVSFMGGELSPQSPVAATTKSDGRSPTTMLLQRAAALLKAAASGGVIGVRKRREMLYALTTGVALAVKVAGAPA